MQWANRPALWHVGVIKRVRRDKTQFARYYLTLTEVKQNLYCWMFSATTKTERKLTAIHQTKHFDKLLYEQ